MVRRPLRSPSRLLIIALAVACMAPAASFRPFPGVKVNPGGDMQIEEMLVAVVFFSPKWTCSRQGHASIGEVTRHAEDAQHWALDGAFHTRGELVPFAFHQEMTRIDGGFSYAARLEHPTGLASNTLALSVRLPVALYEGKRVFLDGEALRLEPNVFESGVTRKGIRKIRFPGAQGAITVEGDFQVLVQDGRRTAHPYFRFRLMFSESSGMVRDSSLTARVAFAPPAVIPVDIRSAANMGFRDDVDGDRQGGWTDQGDNDIRMLKPGRGAFGSIPFDVIAPASNAGRSCLVFAGPGRPYFLTQAELPVGSGPHDCLYLLHATAWTPRQAGTPVGTVRAAYADGTETAYELHVGRDVGNWFQAVDLENGVVGWTGVNARSDLGLYVTKVPLEARPVKAVRLEASQKVVWMVVALSVGENVDVWKAARRHYVFSDSEWHRFEHRVSTEPGSVLDFSSLVDRPAGKYGPVVARNGHFEFKARLGQTVRFHGTNICHMANYQDKPACEFLAAELARKGYNSARLHHFGAQLPKRGGPSTDFDPERRDRIDYLFHCLKQQGLYMNIDLYTTRTVKQGEIEEIDRDVRLNDFKALMPVSASALANWKTYARYVLTHTNSYTGLAWKDDPALYGICLVNEGNLHCHWKGSPDIAALYQKRYAEWLEERGLSPESAPIGTSPRWTEFIVALNRRLTQECAAFVRSLGTTALITDANYRQVLPSILLREDLDYVDNHLYWDLKKFLKECWQLPYGHHQLRNTSRMASAVRLAMPTRDFSRPFTVTEFNYCFPNHHRAEGGVLMGAYAAFQDWDGIYRYCYAHSGDRTQESRECHYLENASDPVNVLSDRIGSLLFLRRDVAPATTRIPFVYSDHMLAAEGMLNRATGIPGDACTALGLLFQLGCVKLGAAAEFAETTPFSVISRPTWPHVKGLKNAFEDTPDLLERLVLAGRLVAPDYSAESNLFSSETGQLRMDGKNGSLTVVTPLSECFVLVKGQERKGSRVQVAKVDQNAVIAVASVDGQAIGTSRRLLVLHLTDVMNTGTTFDNEAHTVLSDWGKLPHLVRRGSAELQIALSAPEQRVVHAVDVGGTRLWQVPSSVTDGRLSFRATTVHRQGTCMAYEIVSE